MMLISLYTSRVVLNALGVEDYGIYTVVGGVVSMFSLISASLSTSISRFITYELGAGRTENLMRVFSSSVTIQIGLAVIVVFIAETVGLWFVNYKLVVPDIRLSAANWCYQFSILSFVIGLISVPYNAAIIAHEKMSAFAYISILDAIGKLLIAWMILCNPIDRLVFYAALIAVMSCAIRMVYTWYCKHHFEECTYHFIYDHSLLKKMFGFAGWNFIGASSYILRESGGNILINLFYGPVVNAARAISSTVNTAVSGFVNNFMVALDPQITKSYASENKEYMFYLMFMGARFSFFILLLLSLPLIINTPYVLMLWLKMVPDHSVLFVQLALVLSLSECLSGPLVTAMLATGRIRNYQLVVGGLQMLNFPLALLALYMGAIPEIIVIIAILLDQLCLASRLVMLHKMIGLDIKVYLSQVYLRILVVTLLSMILPALMYCFLSVGFQGFVVSVLITVCSTAFVELYIGCSQEERSFVWMKATNLLSRFSKG